MNAAEQKAFFDDNGFVVVPDIIPADDLAAMRSMVDRVLDGTVRPEPVEGVTYRNGLPSDFAIQWEPALRDDDSVARRNRIRVVFHLCHTHPFFRAHAVRPELLDVVANLIGPDVKLYTDQAFMKPAKHGSEVPFHQDQAYWPQVETAGMLSCWFAIDDVTIENGCVHFLPGTHRQAVEHRTYEGVQTFGLEESDVDASNEVPVEMKAGSACLHHSRVVHRSFPNRSDKSRRGLVTVYMPASTRLVSPWDFEYGFTLVRGREFEGCV